MLKELEDYVWFPTILRRWQMDFIGSLVVFTNLYQPLIPFLQNLVSRNRCATIQDVCSGSGQPAKYVWQKLDITTSLTLSDKFPDGDYTTTEPTYCKDAVDIIALQPQKNTCYTMYNAFHHFDDDTQKQIVLRMANAHAPFLFVEVLQPNFINVVKIFFSTTIVQLIVAPFLKPFSLARLFFTYLIPINIFTITYDGIISVLKSKTTKQFATVLNTVSSEAYGVKVQHLKSKAATIIYIIGEPTKI